jgi:hypothetical protein
MKTLRNEKGFALLFVLILAAIALIMTLGMLFMVSRGSYVSGQQKRYRTALEASRGGAEAMLQLIASRNGASLYSSMVIDNSASFITKLNNPTDNWLGLGSSITVTPSTYDMKVDFWAYTAYVKVVDTVVGNTGPSLGLLKSGVVTTSPSEISGMVIPYLYTIEVLSQSKTNPTERSKLSVLYQY